jgi:hypothetical protein
MVVVIVVNSNFVHATLVQKHNAHAACALQKCRTHATCTHTCRKHPRTHAICTSKARNLAASTRLLHVCYIAYCSIPYGHCTQALSTLHLWCVHAIHTLHAHHTHAARTLKIPFLHATCRAHACRTNAEHTPHHTSHTCRMHATLLVHTPCTQTLDMP